MHGLLQVSGHRATMKSCVCIHCTADVLPNTVVVSHSYIVLLSVGGVIVAQEVCSSVIQGFMHLVQLYLVFQFRKYFVQFSYFYSQLQFQLLKLQNSSLNSQCCFSIGLFMVNFLLVIDFFSRIYFSYNSLLLSIILVSQLINFQAPLLKVIQSQLSAEKSLSCFSIVMVNAQYFSLVLYSFPVWLIISVSQYSQFTLKDHTKRFQLFKT